MLFVSLKFEHQVVNGITESRLNCMSIFVVSLQEFEKSEISIPKLNLGKRPACYATNTYIDIIVLLKYSTFILNRHFLFA
jgi:hypothetical protein